LALAPFHRERLWSRSLFYTSVPSPAHRCQRPNSFRTRRTDPRAAMLTGKISFRGEMALGIKLGYWVRKAVKQGAADTGALEENVELEIAETDKWERDEDTHLCAVCQRGFKVGCLDTGCTEHALGVSCHAARVRHTYAHAASLRSLSAFSTPYRKEFEKIRSLVFPPCFCGVYHLLVAVSAAQPVAPPTSSTRLCLPAAIVSIPGVPQSFSCQC